MSRSTQERIIMLLLPYKYYNILWWITVIYCALTHTHNNTIIHSYQHTYTHTNIGCIKENNLVLPLHMRQYYILAICRVRMIDRRRSNRHPGRKWHLGEWQICRHIETDILHHSACSANFCYCSEYLKIMILKSGPYIVYTLRVQGSGLQGTTIMGCWQLDRKHNTGL